MKTKLTVLSALALVALMACQREKVADNPTYDPVTQTVNTQFIVNVSTGTGSPDTKQTASDTQQSFENFRGIEAAHVLAYTLNYKGVNGECYLYKPTDASSKATRDFDLGTLVSIGDLTKDDTRRLIELNLPVGTDAILIYGRAPKTGTNEEQGLVDYSGTALNSTLDNVKFVLQAKLSKADSLSFRETGDLLGRMLTGIMNAGCVMQTAANGHKVTTPKDSTYKFWWPIDETSKGFSTEGENGATRDGYTLYKGSKKWKEYGDAYAANPAMSIALEGVMGEAYHEMMSLKSKNGNKELRAGSAAAVVRMVGDMYNILARVLNATPTVPEEYVCQLVAKVAYNRAKSFFHYDESTSTMNFRTRREIMDGVNQYIPDRTEESYAHVPESAFYYKKTGASDTRTEYPGFPINFGLPFGASVMSFQEVGPSGQKYDVVMYDMEIPAYGMGGSELKFNVMDYLYPAELVYYTNSSIRTSDSAAEKKDFPASSGAWGVTGNWGSMWNGNVVSSTTRAVAVSKPINYGTALLKSQFAYGSAQIEDNNGGIHTGENNNKITVTGNNEPFKVSGIIIGGVDKSVGWDFLPNGTGFKGFIYDNLGGTTVRIPPYVSETLEYSSPVFTCTWDNYNAALAPDAQSKVYIGLELINNTGMDIWGELNLIRNGGTFYVVGELDPTKAEALVNLKKDGVVNLSRPDFYYPPFDENGRTVNAPRVFMQDYVTTAKFIFTNNTLKHAYVTMPDLRAGQVSLGLSVDLTWQPGMEFTSEMGVVSYGGN
ncbi:MAG: hypothetical protein J6M23_02010 [Bacteroidales bacterium]|nr:hypothetical protein [Bacteroidales bacterium]